MQENYLWYPYTQMKNYKPKYIIEKGEGVYVYTKDGKKLIDGISSWWAAIHGYNNKELNNVIVNQIDKISHFMLGGATHESAINFARKLVEITPKGLNHVFYGDSGSVGVEVALKMSAQFWHNKGIVNKKKFISLKNSYHGDTFKTMEVGDDFSYHIPFSNYFRDTYFVSAPDGFDASENDINNKILELTMLLNHKKDEIAAIIIEPIAQCAGGFKFHSPKYLDKVYEICKKNNVLVIFDEVATGFGRTGKLFATEYTNIVPDIMVLGKGLTAGYLGHSATLATTEIFEGFYGDDSKTAFMHGPTFMGNPIVCEIGIKSIEIFQRENYIDKIKKIESKLKKLYVLHSEKIKEIRVLGAIAVIELYNSKDYDNFVEFAVDSGVWLRPFGNTIYIMPPYIINESELDIIINIIFNWFK